MMVKYKIILFCIFIGSILFLGNLRINSSINQYIKDLESKNYKINFTYKEKLILIYKNTITLHNFYIEDLNDSGEIVNNLKKYSNLKAKKLILNFNIFSVFTGKINNIDVADVSIDFYQHKEKNIEIVKNIFKNLSGKFNIENCDLYIYNKNFILSEIINSISGKLDFQNEKIKIAANFYERNDFFEIKADLSSKIFDSSGYDSKVEIVTNSEKLVYSGEINFQNNELYRIDSEIKASGANIEKILRLFSWNERKYQSYNDKKKFTLDAKVNFEKNILKISNIKYEKGDTQINGEVLYDNAENQVNINLNINELQVFNSEVESNLFNLKNQILDDKPSQIMNLFNYYNFIESLNYNLDLKIEKVKISNDHEISDLNFIASAKDKKTLIKKLNGKLDKKYNISTVGEILNNGVRNQLRMKVLIPLDNKNEKIDVTFGYIDGYITFNNINIVQDDLIVSGKANLSLNKQINFLSGEINVSNYNVSNFLKKMSRFLENKDGDKNGILTNILLLANKIKINSDLKINLKDSTINGNKVEDLSFLIKNDEKRISIIDELRDEKFFSLKDRYELSLNELRPQLKIKINGNTLNIKSLLKLFRIEDGFFHNYFLFSDAELRKKTDKAILKDVKINFEKFHNIDFSIESAVRDVVYNQIKIDNFVCSVSTKSNIIKINSCSSKIEQGKIDLQGNFNLEDNSIASMIKVDSLNFNNLSKKKREKPMFVSATGKFFSSGSTIPLFIKNAVGRFEYLSYNYHVDNLNLDLFVSNTQTLKNYSDLISLSERSVVSGETIFNDLKGSLDMRDGIISTNFQFSSDKFTGAGIFNISGQSSIFKGLTRIAFIPINYKNVIYADLDWGGNLYNTNKAFNIEKLKGLVGRY